MKTWNLASLALSLLLAPLPANEPSFWTLRCQEGMEVIDFSQCPAKP